jgi:hypothetical protein
VLLRLAYLGVTNALALLRLLPMSDRDKDAEILVLRHQVMVLQRQLHGDRVRFTSVDRAWLAALLHQLPRTVLNRLRLLVRPETVLRWHRDLIARRHARRSRPRRPGRPPTIRSIRRLVLCLASENTGWGYRRIHGELLVLGVKVAASTVWEILKGAGIDPAPDRTSSTWATFLRSQGQAVMGVCLYRKRLFAGGALRQVACSQPATTNTDAGTGWTSLLRIRRSADPYGLRLTGEPTSPTGRPSPRRCTALSAASPTRRPGS